MIGRFWISGLSLSLWILLILFRVPVSSKRIYSLLSVFPGYSAGGYLLAFFAVGSAAIKSGNLSQNSVYLVCGGNRDR